MIPEFIFTVKPISFTILTEGKYSWELWGVVETVTTHVLVPPEGNISKTIMFQAAESYAQSDDSLHA